VFGREDCGLHTDELLQCTHVCTIPTGSWQGSLSMYATDCSLFFLLGIKFGVLKPHFLCGLDLSHAVTVVLSRLYESWAPKQSDIYETVRQDSAVYKTLPGQLIVLVS
jgi:tRNA C32,U32 (ribose-2'-O)-methylase TrmJ